MNLRDVNQFTFQLALKAIEVGYKFKDHVLKHPVAYYALVGWITFILNGILIGEIDKDVFMMSMVGGLFWPLELAGIVFFLVTFQIWHFFGVSFKP